MMIEKFIKENKLSFKEGSRNSTVTIIIGYGQFLGLSKDKLKEEVAKQILRDNHISVEIDRLYRYCEDRKYKDFWQTKEAKSLYNF